MRRASAPLGLALLAAAWLLPLDRELGHFPGHMLRHASVVAVIAPLLVLGFPALSRRVAVGPLPASVLEAVVVWTWHLPALHGWARSGALPAGIEQASFLAAGLLVWAGALAPGPRLGGAGALLLTSMHMTLLGALLILAPRDLYPSHHGSDLAGQQLGGVIMLAIATPAYLLGGLALVAASLRDGRPA